MFFIKFILLYQIKSDEVFFLWVVNFVQSCNNIILNMFINRSFIKISIKNIKPFNL